MLECDWGIQVNGFLGSYYYMSGKKPPCELTHILWDCGRPFHISNLTRYLVWSVSTKCSSNSSHCFSDSHHYHVFTCSPCLQYRAHNKYAPFYKYPSWVNLFVIRAFLYKHFHFYLANKTLFCSAQKERKKPSIASTWVPSECQKEYPMHE